MIRANAVSFQFYLRLPQHSVDVASLVISTVSTPASHGKVGTAISLGSCFTSSSPASATPSSSTGTSTPSGTPTKAPATNPGLISPAMKLFLLAKNDPKVTKNGFYGDLTFLDSQHNVDTTFGINPRIMPVIPTGSDIHVIQKLLRDFSEACRLDIFMHLCMLDYVGHDKLTCRMYAHS